jgi:hypothetical protein
MTVFPEPAIRNLYVSLTLDVIRRFCLGFFGESCVVVSGFVFIIASANSLALSDICASFALFSAQIKQFFRF